MVKHSHQFSKSPLLLVSPAQNGIIIEIEQCELASSKLPISLPFPLSPSNHKFVR